MQRVQRTSWRPLADRGPLRHKALSGRAIVVTRPREQAGVLAVRIEAAGGVALVYPAIEISEPANRKALMDAVDGLAKADLAIFVSPTAVRKSAELIRERGGWPAHLMAAAVGPGTRRELEAQGVCGVLAPDSGADSEALLAMPKLNGVAGQRVVIFRGEGGRELLGDRLRARGALVQYAECYRRTRPQTDMSPLLETWAAGGVDGVTAFSGETVANLFAMLGDAGRKQLQHTPLFVPHLRIAEEATKRGAGKVLVAGPGNDEMVACLVAYFPHAK